MKKPNYSAANFVISFLTTLAWLGIIASIGFIIYANLNLQNPLKFYALPIAISVLVLSILGLAGAQLTRANIDIALMSWEMLEIMRGSKSDDSSIQKVNPPMLSKSGVQNHSGTVRSTPVLSRPTDEKL